ncbi:MAG: uncharacterized protein PWP20_1704 [Eubacteriaceae bacterium]|nr:uncharacterized protein [Eubacteriaceae bacterium]
MTVFKNVLETVRMIEKEKLDIRTITMGISLLDCIDSSGEKSRQKIYDKITRLAQNLVKEGERIETELGIPIVNKRISVTPIALIAGASDDSSYVDYAKILDQAAREVGVNFLGGFSALVPKGFTKGDQILFNSIPEALATTERVCSSVNLGSSKTGINMDAVKQLGEIIKQTAYLTREADSIGCAKFVAFANAVDDNPFMAGAFHGITESESVLNVGVSGITRAGHLVGTTVADRLGVPFGILDLSLAPTPEIGDSVARILEEMGLEHCGTHGTTAALAMLNDAVKKGGIMASTSVGGFSGAFIPVSEDEGMIEAVQVGALSFDKLEAMTSVCSVGIDMVAIPGDTPASTISAIIADEAAIGVINNKTTGVRIIPVHGKTVGDSAEFGGLLGRAPIMPVNPNDSSVFINRGGQIPAPIHSFKN